MHPLHGLLHPTINIFSNSYYGPSVGTFGAAGIEAAVAPAPVHSTVTVTKTATPQLYNDIFNVSNTTQI